MSKYMAEFHKRLLYKQNYTADENVSVFSCAYAIMWGLNKEEPLTTSRLRLTMLFTRETSGIQPVQGLIEQWKTDGWQIIDEFVDLHRDFMTQEDFEDYLLKMARSFLLGIPIDSEIVSEDLPKPPSSGKAVKIPASRIEKLIKKETKKEEDKPIKDINLDDLNPEKLSDDDDIYIVEEAEPSEEESQEKSSQEVVSEDESDDEWI